MGILDWLPMSPSLGPPFPRFLGVYWPWVQPTAERPREFLKGLIVSGPCSVCNEEVEEIIRDDKGFIKERRIRREVKEG